MVRRIVKVNSAYLGLAVVCVVTSGVIGYVHWDHRRERLRMEMGVVRDAERERYRNLRAGIPETKPSSGPMPP